MGKTLLEQAKETRVGQRNFTKESTPEHFDLAIAWAKGEIRTVQVSNVLYPNMDKINAGGKTLYTLATILREAVKRGILVRK
jgi:hypothetical protein